MRCDPGAGQAPSGRFIWVCGGHCAAVSCLAFLITCVIGFASRAEILSTNKWMINVGQVDSSPAVGNDGTIYFGSFDQKFWAVSSNGVPEWSFETGSEIWSSPAIGKDGTVYFGCRDRKFYALTSKGKEKWEFATDGWVDSSPALAEDGTIYFGSWDGWFYALNPDGSLKWKFQTGAEINSSPAVGMDGAIYFGSHDKKFYALSPNGQKIWDYATGGPIISSPALNGEGVIYFTSVDGFFYALNADGSLSWRLRTGGITSSSPVIGPDGTLYVAVNDYLCAIGADGKEKWRHYIGVYLENYVESSPWVMADGRIYVVVPFLSAWGVSADGTPAWVFYADNSSNASAGIGSGGMIYFPAKFSNFYSLKASAPLAQSPWPKFRGVARNTGNLSETRR